MFDFSGACKIFKRAEVYDQFYKDFVLSIYKQLLLLLNKINSAFKISGNLIMPDNWYIF